MTSDICIHYMGWVEIPRIKNFVEEVAKSLKIELSPFDLMHVKWLVFKSWSADYIECCDCWRDNDMYCELDRKRITRFIKLVTSSRANKEEIPKQFRDYHEFGIDIDSD